MQKPRVRMITPIWGDYYIKRWFDLCIASLRSADNFSYLNEHCDFELAIVTKEADVARLQDDPRFAAALTGIKVRFVTLDEFFPPNGKTDYGVPLTLAYAKGILDLGPAGIGTYVILMNADFVVTPGSLKSVVQEMYAGYGVILGTSIRTIEGPMRAWLYDQLDTEAGVLSVPPRRMMRKVFENLHNHATARIINEPNIIETAYYNQVYWRLGPDCLAMRGLLLTPFCFRVDRLMEKVLCPVDYGFITEFCPDGTFCAMGDSDSFLMVELQEPISESYLLRVAPRFETAEARLSWLADDIVRNIQTWATSEQRRSFSTTLYYHVDDLPADVDRLVAPFEAFIDSILGRLSPPISHISHWHWLPAVRIYREDMTRGGAQGTVALIDDPRNDVVEVIPESHFLLEPPAPVIAPQPPDRHRERIGRMVQARLADTAILFTPSADYLYIGDVEPHSPKPPGPGREARLTDPSGPDQRRDFAVVPPPELTTNPNEMLVVYAGIGLLAVWDRLEHDLEAFLARRRRVVLVFIRQGFEPLLIATHTYILSLLMRNFPRRKYRAVLDVYAPDYPPDFDDRFPGGVLAGLRRWWIRRCREQDERLGRTDPGPLARRFSALIVTAEARSDR